MGTMETDIFKEEAYDLLDDIEAALLELRDNPGDSELINRLFRAFHTIKGSGAMFGFKAVSKFTHEVETAIDKIREGSGVVPDALREVLLTARDQILTMIETDDPESPAIQESAQLILAQLAPAISTKSAPLATPQSPAPASAPQPEPPPAPPKPAPQAEKEPDPETVALINEISELLNEVRKMLQELQADPDSAKLRKKLHRSLHTVEGTASMYEMAALAGFSGKLTEAVEAIKEDKTALNSVIIEKLSSSLEHCFTLLRSADPSGPVLQRRSDKIINELTAILNKGQGDPKSTQPLKFLIVEDEFISRYLLQEFLTPYGNSHVAIDGYEAIMAFKNAMIEKKPYHMICLDIMMPGLDGRQVAKEIRRLEKEMGDSLSCKVVMTTALDDQNIKDELLQAKHCDAYLTKPLRFEDLEHLMRAYFPDSMPTKN
ncbi:MAG: Hpt domain-containing protein [Desulfobulbaceae bacterium]|nr:Hpt domain-containing protein [Desulfobulbaceae bacterium]